MIQHSQSAPSNKLVVSLKYLKKKSGVELFFLHEDKQSYYQLSLLFLMEVARHVQSNQNGKLIMFLQYIKKKVSQLLLCSLVMKNTQIIYWVSVMFIVTFYLAP